MMAMNATDLQAQGVVPAQKGEKTFTLEDLNFGGNNYRNMVAKNRWCTWWGNELVRQDVDACYLVNKTTGKETKLFGINDINQWIAPTKDIKVRALYNALFPFAGKSIVMVSNGSKTYTVDFKKHKLLSEMDFADGENLLEANAQQNAFAYLKGSNLYVRTFDVTSNALTKEKKSHDFQLSKDGSREIVYGQSVHRDEFGISKGTFWSPNGELLAFYRMDQSMVTDYPQVDIPEIGFNHPETQSCIATPAPDKYPMTGETSHKVTVGVFDCMTGKTIYLKAVDAKGQEITLTEKSDSLSELSKMTGKTNQYTWYQVKYDAKGNVTAVEPASSALKGYERIVKFGDIQTAIDKEDTVLLEAGTVKTMLSLKGSTLYSMTDKTRGVVIDDDTNIVFIQTNNNKETTSFETGVKALETALKNLNEVKTDVYNYEFSAIIEDGIATTVVIHDNQPDSYTGNTGSTNADLSVSVKNGVVTVTGPSADIDEIAGAIVDALSDLGYTDVNVKIKAGAINGVVGTKNAITYEFTYNRVIK